jgi:hypothetical protein
VGIGALPYVIFFEGVGPLFEIAGYAITAAAAITGLLDWTTFGLLIAVSVLFGVAATLVAVFLNDVVTRRYMGGSDLVLLVVAAILENCGYRQLNSWWSSVGTVRTMTGRGEWGLMKRRVFEGQKTPV